MATLPENCTVLYRIMTEKSILGFGKYATFHVGDVMICDREYLVWAYATQSNVSFHDRILEELGVRKIAKPGIDWEVLHEWRKKQEEGLTEEQKFHGRCKRKRLREGKLRAALAREISARDKFTSKAYRQAINHGHIKK